MNNNVENQDNSNNQSNDKLLNTIRRVVSISLTISLLGYVGYYFYLVREKKYHGIIDNPKKIEENVYINNEKDRVLKKNLILYK